MKKLIKYVLTTIICTVLTATAFPQESDGDHFTIPLSDPSRPATVKVSVFKGSMTVTGYDGQEIIVDMEYQGNNKHRKPHMMVYNGTEVIVDMDNQGNDKPPKADTTGLKRIAVSGRTVIDEENNTVYIRNNSIFNTKSIKLQVPRRTSLVLKNTTNGDITIEQVHGEIEVSAITGNVTLTDVAGSVVAHAMNGDMNVILKEIDPDKPMSFSSMTGDIDVSFPEDLKANVSISTVNGEVYSGFDIKRVSTKDRVRDDASEKDKNFKLEFGGKVKGSINGGGPEIQFNTYKGNIYIRKLSQ